MGADDPGRVMKNFSIYNDEAVLDLVAHFLGIATHDNINAAPSGLERLADRRDPKAAQPAGTSPSKAVDFGLSVWRDP